MKYFNLSAIAIFFVGLFYLLPNITNAYTITAGDPVKLNAISSNVYACLAQNNYYVNNWGGNSVWAPAPYGQGTRTYFANQIVVPGTYNFSFGCQDDDSANFFTASDVLVVLPRVPVGLADSCNAANTRANLSWGAVQYATDYRVVITRPGSGCPVGWANYGAGECVAYPGTNAISFDTQSGFNYSWRVYARAGTLSSYSSVVGSVTCTVPVAPPPIPPAPPNINFSCNAAGNNVTLSWPAVAGATLGYHVRLNDPATPANPDQADNNHPATSISYPVIPGHANVAWVHSVNVSGWSPAAASVNFTCVAPPPIPPAPPNIVATCNALGNSVTLNWPAVAGASDGYHVRLNYASTPISPDLATNNHPSNSITYSVIPGVANNAWIHSVNVSGWSPVPASVNFTCLPPPPLPPPPSISYTCNGAGDSVTLSWPAVAGANSYRIRLDYASTVLDPDRSASNHVPTSVTYPVIPGVANNFTVNTVNIALVWGAARAINFTCSVPPSACLAGVAKNWTVGGNTCNGLTPLTPSGANGLITDSISPTTGNAQFMCNNGVWSLLPQAGSTCATPPAGTPDLTILTHNLGSYSNLTQGNPINLAGIMRNSGTLTTGLVTYTKFTYKWGAAGAWNDVREFNKGIVPPTTNTPQDLVVFTPNQSGSLYLQYCVDSRNQIPETGAEGNNCVQVGPITVNPVVVPPVAGPSGSISVDPCVIAVGNADCQARVVWNSSDFVGSAEVLQGANVFSTEYSNAGIFRAVSFIDNSFTLRDAGSGYTTSANATVSCAVGSIWVPGLGLCAALPQIEILADPDVIRSGETANVVIEIDSEFDLICVMKDGGHDVSFNHVGSVMINTTTRTTRPLTAAQMVSIRCESQLYPELNGSSETRVNVVPTFEEI